MTETVKVEILRLFNSGKNTWVISHMLKLPEKDVIDVVKAFQERND